MKEKGFERRIFQGPDIEGTGNASDAGQEPSVSEGEQSVEKETSALEQVRNLDLSTEEGREALKDILTSGGRMRGMNSNAILVDEAGESYLGAIEETERMSAREWGIRTDWGSGDFALFNLCDRRQTPQKKERELSQKPEVWQVSGYFGDYMCKRGPEFGMFPKFGGELLYAATSKGLYYQAQSFNQSYFKNLLARFSVGPSADDKEQDQYQEKEFPQTEVGKLFQSWVSKAVELEEKLDNYAFHYVQEILRDRNFQLPPAVKDEGYWNDVAVMKGYGDKRKHDENVWIAMGFSDLSESRQKKVTELHKAEAADIKARYEANPEEFLKEELESRIGAVDTILEIMKKYYSDPESSEIDSDSGVEQMKTSESPESVESLMNELLSRTPSPEEQSKNEDLIADLNEQQNVRLLGMPDTTFAEFWGSIPGTPDVLKSLQSKIDGAILVDLGGGPGYFGDRVKQCVPDAKLKAYINVEKYYPPNMGSNKNTSPEGITYTYPSELEKEKIDSNYQDQISVQEDMLRFLQHVPDASIDMIAMNGIDHAIIPLDSYRVELAYHIARTLRPGGVVFSSQSFIKSFLLENKQHWKSVEPPMPKEYGDPTNQSYQEEWRKDWERSWRMQGVCVLEKI